jgi:polyisoprenyl-teichoic acid--peptidoglycan teichoic acid transferase
MSRLSGDEESITLDMPKAPRRRKQSQKKELKSKRHIARKALSTMLIIFLLGGGYLFGKGYLSILNIFRGGGNALALEENIDPSRLRGEGDGRVNILLLGRGGEGHDGADLTDTIIVASIDPVNKKTALLSIPRDLYVNLGDYGSMKINQVFFTGKNYDVKENEQPNDAGMRLLENTLEDTIGIPIHYHVLVDFEGFRKTIDTVGGIETNVPEELAVYEYYPESGYVLDVDAGNQKFDGLRALAFARTRKTSARGDFDRSERQRLMMIALKDKVFSLGTFGNPVTVNKLIGDFGNHITSNFTTEEVLRIYEIMQEVPNDQIASVGLADEPQSLVTTGNINGLSVVIPRAGAFQYDAIKHFVRNALRDGFLENENASVDVYNGTYIGGLAGRTADELESFGYSVGTVADAPQKGMQDTVLIDLTGGDKKYTKSYLETRFGVTALTSMPSGTGIDPGQANFVIILGQNEERRLEN